MQGNLKWMPGYIYDQHSSKFNKKSSYYLDRELHTRRIVSTVMMLIDTCARGSAGMSPLAPEKNDKNGAILCIFSAPKYVIINLKSTIFRMINQQQPKI